MSIIAARFIDAFDRFGVATVDTYAAVFTDIGEVRIFHKDSPDTEWQRYLAHGGVIAAVDSPFGPQLTNLDPATAEIGVGFVLRVLGSGFSDASQIVCDGEPVPTTFISEDELNVDIPETENEVTVEFWVVDRTLETQRIGFTFTAPVEADETEE